MRSLPLGIIPDFHPLRTFILSFYPLTLSIYGMNIGKATVMEITNELFKFNTLTVKNYIILHAGNLYPGSHTVIRQKVF